MKITYYAATSLDGFIAKPDGDVAWLDELNISPSESGYDGFYSTIDCLVMGRATYEFVFNYGQWPYENKPTWICSHQTIPMMEGCNYQPENTPQAVFEKAKAEGFKHMWLVGGGKLAQSFIESKLLTHLSLSLMPVILGEGIPAFGGLANFGQLQMTASEFSAGFSQLEYKVNYN